MFFEMFGWAAVFIFLTCQIYVSTFPTINKSLFFIANTIGAIFMIISSWAIGSWMLVIYNIIWVGISTLSFLNLEKVRCPISLRLYRNTIYIILIAGLTIAPFNQLLSINIIGYGSIFILTINYLLFSTNQIKRSQYLRYAIVGLSCAAPQLYIDQNIPALTSQYIFITITAFGIIRHYVQDRIDRKNKISKQNIQISA